MEDEKELGRICVGQKKASKHSSMMNSNDFK